MPNDVIWSPTREDICVCGVGGRTPLGFDSAASAAAVRGGLSAIGLHPIFLDTADKPMSLAWDPGLEFDAAIGTRTSELLSSAIEEAFNSVPRLPADGRVACVVGVAEPRPGWQAEALSIPRLPSFDSFSLHLLPRGHAAGLMAIQIATRKIAAGELDYCVAAGVDSYHDSETLRWLDSTGRLLSAKNRNGFSPSEGAGACLLTARSTAMRYGLPIYASIAGASTTFEPKGIRSDEVCVGEGLTAALRGITRGLRLPDQAITATYCDLNGERYRSEEFVYTLLRVQQSFVDAHDFQTPADCWGDTGAACGLLFLCLAIAAHERGYAKGTYPLLWAGSESGYRSAVLLKSGPD